MAKSFSRPRVLPKRGGLRLSDQQRKAATIWYNWYAGGGGGLFVSNAGSGDGSGKNADNAISLTDFISRGIEAGDRILLKKGETYDIGEIDIDVANVRFDAYGVGNNPILRGSEDISGLTWTDEEDGTWSTPMVTEPNWIWISGRCAKLAETPRVAITGRGSTTTITVNPANLSSYSNIVGAYLVAKDKPFSSSLRVKVTNYNAGTGVITIDHEIDVNSNVDLALYNKFEFFEDDGEWAWENGELRIKSSVDPSTLDIRMSSYDYCFKDKGNTRFENLELQEFYQFGIWSDEGVSDIRSCSFHDIRDAAIYYERQVTGANVSDCTITRIGNNGIATRPLINSTFLRNTITEIDRMDNYGWNTIDYHTSEIGVNHEQNNGCGIFIGNIDFDDDTLTGSGNRVEGCIIDNVSHRGISLVNSSNSIITKNKVTNFMNRYNDGGGIYTFHYRKYNVPQQNTEIANNIVYDSNGAQDGMGIYCDNRTIAAHVHHNVVYDCQWGILLNRSTSNHVVEDNIVRNCVAGVVFRVGETNLFPAHPSNINNQFRRNVITCLTSNQRCMLFDITDGDYDDWNPFEGGESDNNYYINATTAAIANSDNKGNNLTLAQLRSAYGQDANSVYRDNKSFLITNETAFPVTDELTGIPYAELVAADSQKIDVGTTADIQFERSDSFSISFWIRTTNADGQIIFTNVEEVDSRGIQINTITTTGLLFMELRNAVATNRYRITTDDAVNDGQWHHILIVSPSTFTDSTIYVDGALADVTEVNNLTETIVSAENANIGSRSTNVNFFDGEISQIAIWASDQSSNISAIYENGNRNIDLAQLPSPPLHYWRIQPGQNDADKFADTGTSSNKLHGTGVNDPNVATDNFVDVDLEEITEYTIPAHYGLIYLTP